MSPPRTHLFPHLRTPIRIGALELPHRLLMGSMHLNLETAPDDGRALAEFYRERVRGGAALIVTGGAAVSPIAAGGPGYAVLGDPAARSRYVRVADAVHAEGGLIALQLFHAGRYALHPPRGHAPVAPSAVYSRFSRALPSAMTEAQIADTVDEFATGAALARDWGFDGVEVMASEGYLLNQFASPVTNLRDDAWGGDARRRRAFPVAVVGAVRAEAGGLAVLVRMSGADLMPGSSTPAEVAELAVQFVEAGADALDIGIGWHESRVPTVQTVVPHGAWVQVASGIREALQAAGAGRPVIASNRINTLAHADEIIAAGRADLVSMARPFLADPQIVHKSFQGRPELVNTCIGCNEACIDRSFGSTPVSCLVNPRAGRERQFPEEHAARLTVASPGARAWSSPAVAVVGAGPAGMEAARAAAANGARVTLYEAGTRIGGQFLMAGMVPGKADFLETVRYFENELARLGVTTRTGTPVTAPDELAGFDRIIIATGVLPRRVELPGAHVPSVIDYHTAFRAPDTIGSRVAIIGAGGIAVDLAHLLVEVRQGSSWGQPPPGDARERRLRFLRSLDLAAGAHPAPAREVTIMRRTGPIGQGMGITTRWAVVQEIRRAGVRTLTGLTYQRITAEGVWIFRDGGSELIRADTVIVAAGQDAQTQPAAALADAGVAHTVIGGAADPGMNAVTAFEQGLRTGAALAAPLRAAVPRGQVVHGGPG